ncbi:MAG: hemolysin expression modulating protein [Nitrosomonas sp.]|jgi:Ca2+-binding RTX toxin-like protein|nr:MAG: hemolysin expression modulating protein [Nitrosomonas sp.]
MAVITEPRPNIGSSGLIQIIDGIEFEGFGSGGFDEDDLLIIGDEVDNVIEGGIGNDQIEGNEGNDMITGGDGNDTIGGGDGDDIIDGDGGTSGEVDVRNLTDMLFGDAGNDIILSGAGHDRMTGGSGNDTFGFYGAGHFQVNDFIIGEDQLFFDSETLGINSVEQLVSAITNIEQDGDGTRVEFLDDIASITLVGVDVNDITSDMIIFTL